MFLNTNDAQLLWYIENISVDEQNEFEVQLELVEYLASFINSDAVRQARNKRKGQKVESTGNVEDQIKNREDIFNDPLVQSVGEGLKKVTNKRKDSSSSTFDIQSALHKIIRD